jgi:hypothetical protein
LGFSPLSFYGPRIAQLIVSGPLGHVGFRSFRSFRTRSFRSFREFQGSFRTGVSEEFQRVSGQSFRTRVSRVSEEFQEEFQKSFRTDEITPISM